MFAFVEKHSNIALEAQFNTFIPMPVSTLKIEKIYFDRVLAPSNCHNVARKSFITLNYQCNS